MWRSALFFFAISFCFFAIQSADVMMNLVIARDFVLGHQWAQKDVFGYLYSSTNGELIWHHEYLSSLLFYVAWWIGGYPGLVLFKIGLLGLLFAIILKSDSQQNRNPTWVAIWILAILAASFRFIERASLFSDLFTVLLVSWLLQAKNLNRQLLIQLVLLFFVWIQLHPGFVVGWFFLLAWGIWVLLTQANLRKSSLSFLLLIPLVMLLNPDFFHGLIYPLRFALGEAQTLKLYNYEWFSPLDFRFRFTPETLSFWLLAALSFYFFIRRFVFGLPGLFATLAFVLALNAVRFVPVAAMILALTVKPFADFSSLRLKNKFVSAVCLIFLVTVGTKNLFFGYESSSGQRLPGWGLDPKFFPLRTMEVLRKLPTAQHIYNSHELGAWLLWNGIKPIFHHGFVTDMNFYRDEVIGALVDPAGFYRLATKYGWQVLLVDRFNGYRRLHEILKSDPRWKVVAEDDAAYLILFLP